MSSDPQVERCLSSIRELSGALSGDVAALSADEWDRGTNCAPWRVRDLVAHVEVQALGNLDPHIHFAILSDFKDAHVETLPRDAEILSAAAAGIKALNAKHGDGGGDDARFRRSVRPPSLHRHGEGPPRRIQWRSDAARTAASCRRTVELPMYEHHDRETSCP